MSSIPSWAVKGAEVECIIDAPLWFSAVPNPGLVKGGRYIIDCVSVKLSGRVTLDLVGFEYATFWIGRFRPVTKRTAEDDISEHFAVYLKTPVRTSIRAGERA
jgi:hypothetical protein